MAVAQLPQFQGVDISALLASMSRSSAGRNASLAMMSQGLGMAMRSMREGRQNEAREAIVKKIQSKEFFEDREYRLVEFMPVIVQMMASMGAEGTKEYLFNQQMEAGLDENVALANVSNLFDTRTARILNPEKMGEFKQAVGEWFARGGSAAALDFMAPDAEATMAGLQKRAMTEIENIMKPVADMQRQMAEAAAKARVTQQKQETLSEMGTTLLGGLSLEKLTPAQTGPENRLLGEMIATSFGDAPVGGAMQRFMDTPRQEEVVGADLHKQLRGMAAEGNITPSEYESWMRGMSEKHGFFPGIGAFYEDIGESIEEMGVRGARGLEVTGPAFGSQRRLQEQLGGGFVGEPAVISGVEIHESPAFSSIKARVAEIEKDYGVMNVGGVSDFYESQFDPVAGRHKVRVTERGLQFMNKKQATDFVARMERVFNEEVGFRSALINRSYGGDLGTPTEKEREAATEEFPARTEKKGARGHQEAQDILRGYRGF